MKILVVDDEPPARARLRRMLADLDHHDVREAPDAPSATKLLGEGVDVVLLDVTMPGMDGLSFAALHRLPSVVFVTGDGGHAARAFDVEAADFLIKPVTHERLARALERARRKVALAAPDNTTVRLRVLDGERECFVDARRIEVFRAESKYVVFDDAGREHVVRESLDELERLLPDHVRVHRSHLVRADAITELASSDEGARALLRSGRSAPVSRRALATVRERLRSLTAR